MLEVHDCQVRIALIFQRHSDDRRERIIRPIHHLHGPVPFDWRTADVLFPTTSTVSGIAAGGHNETVILVIDVNPHTILAITSRIEYLPCDSCPVTACAISEIRLVLDSALESVNAIWRRRRGRLRGVRWPRCVGWRNWRIRRRRTG